jgi:hypothetical protein
MNEYKPTLYKCLEKVIRLIVVWSSFWGEDGDGDFPRCATLYSRSS